jgi:hypothetical protein
MVLFRGIQDDILRMPSSEILRRVALIRTDVSEERSASIMRVTRIGELWTTLAVTGNRRTYFFAACIGCQLRLTVFIVHRFLSTWWWRRYDPPTRPFLQVPHGVISEYGILRVTICWTVYNNTGYDKRFNVSAHDTLCNPVTYGALCYAILSACRSEEPISRDLQMFQYCYKSNMQHVSCSSIRRLGFL